MTILWSSRTPLGVGGVLEQIRGERPLAYTTIMTVLVNLFKKGVVDRAKRGKAYLYWAKEGQDQLARGLFERLLFGYYNGSLEEYFAAFLRYRQRLTPEEVERLGQMLQEHRSSS